jgi:hypothetical protein
MTRRMAENQSDELFRKLLYRREDKVEIDLHGIKLEYSVGDLTTLDAFFNAPRKDGMILIRDDWRTCFNDYAVHLASKTRTYVSTPILGFTAMVEDYRMPSVYWEEHNRDDCRLDQIDPTTKIGSLADLIALQPDHAKFKAIDYVMATHLLGLFCDLARPTKYEVRVGYNTVFVKNGSCVYFDRDTAYVVKHRRPNSFMLEQFVSNGEFDAKAMTTEILKYA